MSHSVTHMIRLRYQEKPTQRARISCQTAHMAALERLVNDAMLLQRDNGWSRWEIVKEETAGAVVATLATCDAGKPINYGQTYAAEIAEHCRFHAELTPEGEQTVIPGCERNASPKATQLDLFG